MRKSPVVITLEDSDSEERIAKQGPSSSQYVGATASVIREEPLNLSMLQTEAVVRPMSPFSSVNTDISLEELLKQPIDFGATTTLVARKSVPSTSRAKRRKLGPQTQTTSDSRIGTTSRESSLNSYCYDSYDPKAPTFESQQSSIKFRCSVGKCRMLLSNNVSFMFHLWAHVAEFSYDNGLDYSREMHRFCCCPQCLHLFPTAYRMQVHYDNVHGRMPSPSACKICEITIHEKMHRPVHGDFDAPFHCKSCRYRTSLRTHFIDHFVRFHSNTHSLLCPFCFQCIMIPKDSRLSVICERGYVRHFLRHQNESYNCGQCSLKFIRQIDKVTHRKDHTQRNPKWTSKSIEMRTRRKGRKLWSKREEQKCVECGEVLNNVYDHFKKTYYCNDCHYRTNCLTASKRHKLINCTRKRMGMTRDQLLPSVVVCKKCKRSSCIGRDILNHARDCSKGRYAVVDLKEEDGNIFSRYAEQLETQIFALRPQDEVRRADDDVVAKLLSPSRIRVRKSLSPSLARANVELQNTRLQSLRTIFPQPQFSFADMLRSASSSPV